MMWRIPLARKVQLAAKATWFHPIGRASQPKSESHQADAINACNCMHQYLIRYFPFTWSRYLHTGTYSTTSALACPVHVLYRIFIVCTHIHISCSCSDIWIQLQPPQYFHDSSTLHDELSYTTVLVLVQYLLDVHILPVTQR